MKKRLSILLIPAAAFLVSCSLFVNQKTLDEVKAGGECITLTEGLKWKDIEEVFGTPDVRPLPMKGRPLSYYTRIYKKRMVILYVESEEAEVEGKTEFHEVVKEVEVCR